MAKFLFDTAFDSPRAGQTAPRKEKPAHTATELTQAREAAFAEGHAAGLEAARAEQGEQLAATVAQMAQILPGLAEIHDASLAALRRDAAALALAVATKLAPALIARRPLAEVEALIAECLKELNAEPRIAVRVAVELADPLAERMAELKRIAGYPGEVVVLGEDGMAAGDCRVEWADGGAERDLAQLTAEVAHRVNQAAALL